MIGSDGVSEEEEAGSVLDGGDLGGHILAHSLEEGRQVDVGGVVAPLEKVALGSNQVVPSLVSGKGVTVEVSEEGGSHDRLDDLGDIGAAGPDVSEEHGLAFLVFTKRLSLEVDVDGASKRVGNDERGRGQVVSAGKGMNTALEVSVSGEDGGNDKVGLGHGGGDFLGEISRVANAGHATVTSGGVSELIKVLVDT